MCLSFKIRTSFKKTFNEIYFLNAMVRKKIKTFITLSLICFFAIKILVANSLRFENLLIQINIYLSVQSGMRNNNKKKMIRAIKGKTIQFFLISQFKFNLLFLKKNILIFEMTEFLIFLQIPSI